MDLNNRLLTTFKDFINDIYELDNEIGTTCKGYYKEELELDELDDLNNYEKLLTFLKTLDKHSKKISDRDEKIINTIKLKSINIKKLWEDLDDINKNNIWKYLQTMGLIKLNIESNNELKNILSGENEIDESNKENLKTLKKMKLLKKGLNKTNEEIDKKLEEEEQKEGQHSPNIENILNNTGIGSLAKEIAEGFELENNDPSEIMNPTNLMSLFTKINTTVQDKIKTGDLDLAKVTNELPDLYSNMQQDPLFNQMVNMQSENNKETKKENNKETKGSKKKAPKKKAPKKKETAKKETAKKETAKKETTKKVAKNKTQERLQKKLEEKNKNK